MQRQGWVWAPVAHFGAHKLTTSSLLPLACKHWAGDELCAYDAFVKSFRAFMRCPFVLPPAPDLQSFGSCRILARHASLTFLRAGGSRRTSTQCCEMDGCAKNALGDRGSEGRCSTTCQ